MKTMRLISISLLFVVVIAVFASFSVAAKPKNEVVQCLAVLKDYEIGAFIMNSEPRKEGALQTVNIYFNDEVSELYSEGSWKRFRDGSQVILNNAVIQNFAGGQLFMDFDFKRGCARNYHFQISNTLNFGTDADIAEIQDQTMLQEDWNFNVNGEEFSMFKGDRYVLQDGSKIILIDAIEQQFNGGLYGVDLEFICN